MRRLILAPLSVTFLFVSAVVGQITTPDGATWPVDIMMSYSIAPNITYSVANGHECKLDVYARRSTGTRVPTLVYIHGGGWVGDTKEEALLKLLPYFEMGFSVVNVEYRLAKVSLAPGAVEDCRLALRWVVLNAGKYGFDTSRIVVSGGSAGGHLALMTGMLDPSAGFDAPKEWTRTDPPMKVAAIINWFGITDVKDLLAGPDRQNYAVSWLGSQSARDDLATHVSPLSYVHKGGPPVLTVHGDNDDIVPYSHALRLHKALTDAGVPNTLITVRGGKHGDFSRDEMLRDYAAIREFLKHSGVLNPER